VAGELIRVVDEWDDHTVLWLMNALRGEDRREIAATRGVFNAGDLFVDWRLAWSATLARGIVREVYGFPVAIFGVVPMTHGVGQACLLATDALKPGMTRSLVHLLRRQWEPVVRRDSGLHRIEALSIEGHHGAHRLLRALGCQHTGTRVAMGRNGEDFHEFTWLNHDLIRQRKEKLQCA
jgi:hypothetical protein